MTAFKLAGKEKLGSVDAQGVACSLEIIGEKALCKMWFDAKTAWLLKRTINLRAGNGQVVFSVVETYSNWDFDPKLKGDEFTVPN